MIALITLSTIFVACYRHKEDLPLLSIIVRA